LKKLLDLTVSNEEHVAFLNILKAYRAKKLLISRSFSDHLITNFTQNGKVDEILKILSNKYRWQVVPTINHITDIMTFYSQKNTIDTYKAFALLLYYSLEPNDTHYIILIRAGLNEGTDESLQMSKTSLLEAKALKLQISKEIEDELDLALENKRVVVA
jgi:hypothetical protein